MHQLRLGIVYDKHVQAEAPAFPWICYCLQLFKHSST